MRKLFTLVSLIVALSLALTACGGGAAPTQAPAATEPAAVATEPASAKQEPPEQQPSQWRKQYYQNNYDQKKNSANRNS